MSIVHRNECRESAGRAEPTNKLMSYWNRFPTVSSSKTSTTKQVNEVQVQKPPVVVPNLDPPKTSSLGK